MSLNDRQCRFVAEYLVDLIVTQAAVRAGYIAATAREQASRLLANAKVAAAIGGAQAGAQPPDGGDGRPGGARAGARRVR